MKKILLKYAFPAIILLIISGAVYADGPNNIDGLVKFADVVDNWKVVLHQIGVFSCFLAAFTGIVLIIFGLMQLRLGHTGGGGGQQQQTAKVGFTYIVIGGLLLCIGTIAAILSNTANVTPYDTSQSVLLLKNSGSASTPQTIYDAITIELLLPALDLMEMISPIVGIILIAVGMHRLRYHSNPQIMSMHRKSPMATGFYFLVGSILIYPFYLIQALSNSIFDTPYLVNTYCGGGSQEQFLSYFNTLQPQMMISFSSGSMQCVPLSATSISDNLLKLGFSVLFIVGFVSFLRGLYMMIKFGEQAGGQDSGPMRVIAHLAAGIFAMNANMFIQILDYTYNIIISYGT